MSSKIEAPRPRSIDRSKLSYVSPSAPKDREVPKHRLIDRSDVEYIRPVLTVLEKNVHSPVTPGVVHFPQFKITPTLEKAANKRIAQYPDDQRRSAVLPLLHEVHKNLIGSLECNVP